MRKLDILRPKLFLIHQIQQNYDTMSGVEAVQDLAREHYCGRLYYISIGIPKWRVDFVIVLNLESHEAVSIQNFQIMPQMSLTMSLIMEFINFHSYSMHIYPILAGC